MEQLALRPKPLSKASSSGDIWDEHWLKSWKIVKILFTNFILKVVIEKAVASKQYQIELVQLNSL